MNTESKTALITVDKLLPKSEIKNKAGIFKKFFVGFFVVFLIGSLIGIGVFAKELGNFARNAVGQSEENVCDNFFCDIGQLTGAIKDSVTGSRVTLKGENNGRTNILIIGLSENLSDTMMIASIYHKEKKIVTLNLPRDLTVGDNVKLNEAYAYATGTGKSRNSIKGAKYLSDFISKEWGLGIDYWVETNFNGVRNGIDKVGGVEVDVQEYLKDCEYPKDDYSGYIKPCPEFRPGKQKMDGKTALIYARSRYSTSDFDRSKRQSIVVQAILETIKNKNLVENVGNISDYLKILGDNLKTSMKTDEILSVIKLMKDYDLKNNFLRVVWSTDNQIFCSTNTGKYIIQYCGGGVLDGTSKGYARTRAKNTVANLLSIATNDTLAESEVLIVANKSKLAESYKAELAKLGFESIAVVNNYSKFATSTDTNTKIMAKNQNLKDVVASLELEKLAKASLEVGNFEDTKYKQPIVITIK
jgi:LCP family protein required for cell wall assembly